VVDLLKRYCHIEDGDEPRTVRAKVTGQVLTLDDALQDTIPAVLSLLDALRYSRRSDKEKRCSDAIDRVPLLRKCRGVATPGGWFRVMFGNS
jgi:hypothetical protein